MRGEIAAQVASALTERGWSSAADLAVACPNLPRATIVGVLCTKHSSGAFLRRGARKPYEYRINEEFVTPPRGRQQLAKRSDRAPAVAYVAPAQMGGSLVPSLGLATSPSLGQLATNTRLEDVVAAMLHRRTERTLEELEQGLPTIWTRTDLLSCLVDGVVDGWITSRRLRGISHYLLIRAPVARRNDPLVAIFKREHLEERCLQLADDLTSALAEIRELDPPDEVVSAIVELKRAASRTAQQVANR